MNTVAPSISPRTLSLIQLGALAHCIDLSPEAVEVIADFLGDERSRVQEFIIGYLRKLAEKFHPVRGPQQGVATNSDEILRLLKDRMLQDELRPLGLDIETEGSRPTAQIRMLDLLEVAGITLTLATIDGANLNICLEDIFQSTPNPSMLIFPDGTDRRQLQEFENSCASMTIKFEGSPWFEFIVLALHIDLGKSPIVPNHVLNKLRRHQHKAYWLMVQAYQETMRASA